MNKTYSRIVWENAPSVATPINERNLNKMDVAVNEIDDRVVTLDGTKANQSDLLSSLKNVEYDEQTGIFTFNYWNGTHFNVDLNIEKIPVSFSMSEDGIITMTTSDGTEYTADVSSLIKTYTFTDSAQIDFTDIVDENGNHTITASIVKGSITADDLEPNYLANITIQADRAELNATESNASRLEAEGWAKGTQNGIPVEEGSPYYANNSKFYSDRASQIADIDIATTEIAGIVKPDGTSIHVSSDGTIDCNGKADNIAYDEENSLLQLRSGDTVLSSVEISGGGATTMIHVNTTEETWINNPSVTVEIHDDTKVYSGFFDASGKYSHKVQTLGAHLVKVTDGAETFEATVDVTQLGVVYNVTIDKFTWGYKGWLQSANISTSGFNSLEDVFASEVTVRELMTKHSSSDYLCDWFAEIPSDRATFWSSDVAMKWIGLRDYICDKLMALYESEMLASEHWQRILKDHVPTMTSNTAPYGEAIASSEYNTDSKAYKAFDGDDTTHWAGITQTSTSNKPWVGYKFVNPICVRRASVMVGNNNYYDNVPFDIQYSNDNSTWVTVGSGNTIKGEIVTVEFENDVYAPYWRLYYKALANNGNNSTNTVQFYGRAFGVSADYSEREFTEGSNIKYLYDHGVELEPMTVESTSALATVDVTPYSLLRATDVDHAQTTDKLTCGSAYATVNGLPNNNYLDISSVNGSNQVGWGTKNTTYLNETSLWLE